MAKSEETIFNLPQYRGRRVELRKNPTEPEKRFWQAVRGKQLGVKFRRQHGIGHYIVDFYCPEWALVVELDGDSHFNADVQASDAKRDAYLRGLGLRVLRFTNLEIMRNLDGVLLRVMQSNPTPALPLPGEGVAHTPALPLSGETVKASAQEMENHEGANSSGKRQRLEGANSSPCEGGGREGVAQASTEASDARANPTPTLPLPGEGDNKLEMAGYLREFGYEW